MFLEELVQFNEVFFLGGVRLLRPENLKILGDFDLTLPLMKEPKIRIETRVSRRSHHLVVEKRNSMLPQETFFLGIEMITVTTTTLPQKEAFYKVHIFVCVLPD